MLGLSHKRTPLLHLTTGAFHLKPTGNYGKVCFLNVQIPAHFAIVIGSVVEKVHLQ
jgi:hypothetical protein